MDKLRNCCVTWHVTGNNTYETLIEKIKSSTFITYGILGREMCPTTGREHIQGYLEFKNQERFDKLIKLWEGVHIEKRMGSQIQAIDYCKKENNFVEFGEKKKMGARTDLKALSDEISNGSTKVAEIIVNNPWAYHTYGRTLEAVEAERHRNVFRSWMTTCEWIFGTTGTGKSHYAFHNWNPEKCYKWKLRDKGWQDGYNGEEYIVINDFRGEIPYNELLDMIDKFPYEVSRRGKAPHPFLARHVVITSSLPPDKIYKHRDAEDSLNQLLRRVDLVRFTSRSDCEARLAKHYFASEVLRG